MARMSKAEELARRKRRRFLAERTGPLTVPVGPVREHITDLLEAGGTYSQIGHVTGMIRESVRYIHIMAKTRVDRDLAARIMRVNPRTLALVVPSGKVQAAGTRRRVQALLAMGYTFEGLTALAQEYQPGIEIGHVVFSGYVLTTTRDAVVRLYDRLWMTLGPSNLNRARALKHGWALPGQWDGVDMDDLWATPYPPRDDALEARLEAAEKAAAEKVHAVRLAMTGMPASQVALAVWPDKSPDAGTRGVERAKSAVGLKIEWVEAWQWGRVPLDLVSHAERLAEILADGTLLPEATWDLMRMAGAALEPA